MFKWSEIIEQNREKLVEVLENTYKEAIDNRHMQYITEIYKNGIIRTWACAAGSTSFSADSWNGESIVVATYCFQNMDIEVTEEDFRRHMTEEEQNKAEMLAEENGLIFVGFIYNSGLYPELIEEVEREWLKWYKDEYAHSEAERTLDDAIIMESSQEEYKERYGEE